MIRCLFYWILKQPGKLVFYLFTIMFLIVQDSHELSECSIKNCFGPIARLQIYNAASGGYLHVTNNTNTVVATEDGANGIIYKISAGQSFYLYDMKVEKFICWKRPPNRLRGPRNNRKHKLLSSLVARKFGNDNCKFIDKVARLGWIYLVPAFNESLKMKFNSRGKLATQECMGRLRHLKKCNQQGLFLFNYPKDDQYEDGCTCPEARRHFCKSKFTKMKVFDNICSLSNETYDR